MSRTAKASGSEGVAIEAAQAALDAGGGAVDAVVGGFFGAAGARAGVLLAPVVALVAGFGAGARAFDGRATQPGLGIPRPRGFVEGAAIPDAARIAVPRSLAMLMLLHGSRGRATLSSLVRRGVVAAEAAGARARAALLRKVASAGALALRNPDVSRVLLRVAGPVAGGTLTLDDLEDAVPGEADALASVVTEGVTVYKLPFPSASNVDAEVVLACDARGTLAALAYAPAREGIPLQDLELEVARAAVPVRRRVARIAPGMALPMASPVAIATRAGGASVVVGLPGAREIDGAAIGRLLSGEVAAAVLTELRARAGGRPPVAVIADRKTARVVTG